MIKIKQNMVAALIISAFSLFYFVLPVKASEINDQNVLYLLNQERSLYNLPKFKIDPDLERASRLKSKDMINRDYFEHYAFNLSPWIFVKNAGYDYLFAGENLAMDFSTSEGMINAWMESPNHKANILNPDFSDIGIGVVKGEFTEDNQSHETVMVTNMFGKRKPAILKAYNYIAQNIKALF